MAEQKLFAVVGADPRQAAAGRALGRAGFGVGGREQIPWADYILLPLSPGLELLGLLRGAKPGALALGGRLSPGAKALAAEAGVELVDYFSREELTILNAVPTAEGCIGLLMAHRTRTLWGSAVLTAGFGPVGQALVPRLMALGAKVTVAARRPAQRALAEAMGAAAAPVSALAELAPGFDAAVNTIPALVFTRRVLGRMPPGSLVIDLASKPGGTDFGAAAAVGVTALHALSLPGRVAPDTAGEFVARAALGILAERQKQTEEAAG